MRISVLVISNQRFCICFKSSPTKPVIYYYFCIKCLPLSLKKKKDRKNKRKLDVFAIDTIFNFQELEAVRKRNILKVSTGKNRQKFPVDRLKSSGKSTTLKSNNSLFSPKALLSRLVSQQGEKYRKCSSYRHFSFVVLGAILEMQPDIFMEGTLCA